MPFLPYFRLMRLDKPIGFLLLLWPTLWALWIAAHGQPRVSTLIIFILGVVLMRAAGCVINDIADRHVDGKVARTQLRPLPQKVISTRSALLLFFVLSLLSLLLVLWLNALTIQLAIFGFCLAALYPFTKRWTHWPQAFLGLAFSWGIPMAFAAETNHAPGLAWALFLINLLWVIAYDTEYAMVDREDDLKIGVKSTAILFAQHDRLIIAGLQLSFLIGMALLGFSLQCKIYFYFGLLMALLTVLYQQFLIYSRQPKSCFKAFLNNHWLGCFIFLGFLFAF